MQLGQEQATLIYFELMSLLIRRTQVPLIFANEDFD